MAWHRGVRFAVMLGTAAWSAGIAGAAPENRTIGLAVTTFRIAHHAGADDCPQGITPLIPAQHLSALPADDRKRLGAPERDPELVFRATTLPSGGDTASAPNEALALRDNYPATHAVQGARSWGLNLDGAVDARSTPRGIRPHANFIGLDGEPGIDNELYRALGCSRFWRWDPRVGEGVTDPFDTVNLSGMGADNIRDGQFTLLIEITDVDDPVNDPDVGVGLYNGRNSMTLDARNRLVAHTSQTVHPNPLWQNRLRGRIVKGVLETKPRDLRLRRTEVSVDSEYFIRDGRLRLELKPDGTARGVLAGYAPVGKMYWPGPAFYRFALAIGIKNPDPSYYRAMYAHADAYPDPETGQFTAISMARAVTAVPAFIFHEAPKHPIAAAVPDSTRADAEKRP